MNLNEDKERQMETDYLLDMAEEEYRERCEHDDIEIVGMWTTLAKKTLGQINADYTNVRVSKNMGFHMSVKVECSDCGKTHKMSPDLNDIQQMMMNFYDFTGVME
tara:strand:+ start:3425 stop:3739 length:315 start_codon:yes stop_codon:yes gene_type:complete